MRALVLACCLLAAGCGSSDGGGGSGDGSWLVFYPPSVSVVATAPSISALRHQGAVINLNAFASRTFADPINVAIVDGDGLIDGATVSVGASTDGRNYWATLFTRIDLPVGLHRGTLEIRLCLDAPVSCARPVSGSPWHVPYEVLVIDDAAYSFARWETAKETVPFSANALTAIGTTLYALASGGAGGMLAYRSADEGVTWESAPSGPPARLSRFGFAGDGAALYVAGGEPVSDTGAPSGPLSSQVLRFDGTTWTTATAAAPFPGRRDPAMVSHGGALYLFGGGTPDGALHDAWKSVDGGATWTQLADLPVGSGPVSCATSWNGAIALVRNVGPPGCIPGLGAACSAGTALWTSTDGSAWLARPGYTGRYLVGATACASIGQRLYLYGLTGGEFGGGVVSSTDLEAWQFEPFATYGDTTAGMPAVGGRLFLLLGAGSTYRPAIRTTPAQ